MSDVTQGGDAPVVAAPPEKSLRTRAIHGTAWTLGGFAVAYFVRYFGYVVCAKLLAPADYGLMAVVTSVLAGFQMFTDLGIGPNIIQNKRGEDPHFLNTAWTIQILRGAGIWGVAALLAYPLALYVEKPEGADVGSIAWFIRVAGLTAIIGGFQSTSLITLNRNLNLGRLTIFTIGTQILGVGATILWAYKHPSVWALVAGSVFGALMRTTFSFAFDAGRHNRFELEPRAVKSLLHFGGWVFVSTLLTYVGTQGDNLAFGGQFSLALVGIYAQARTLARMPLEIVSQVDSSVAFPVYSHAINAGRNLREIFPRVRFPMCVIGTMGVVAAAACGPEIIRILFQPKWHASIAYLPVLCAAGFFQMLELACGSALLAQGKVRWLAYSQGVKAVALPAGIFLGIHLGKQYGLDHGWAMGSDEMNNARLMGALIGMAGADVVKHVVTASMTHATGLQVFRQDALLALLAGAGYFAVEYMQDHASPRVLRALGLGAGLPTLLAELACDAVVVGVFFAWPVWMSVKALRRRGG